jgi:FlaA1/EpsC-like NDP-sugar epimerase
VRELTIAYRRVLVVAVHVALWALAFVGAFLLRFDFNVPAAYARQVPTWLATLLALRAATYLWSGLFHGLWRYSGSRDLLALLRATALSSVLFVAAVAWVGPPGFPRSVYVIEWLASIMLVGGLRFGIRTVREVGRRAAAGAARRRVLVVGAGDAGEMLMREIGRAHAGRYEPVGFVDDNPAKVGERIHGVPVLGPIAAVPALVGRLRVDEVVVAIPSVTGRPLRRIVDVCTSSGARTRVLPGVDGVIDGRVTVSQLQDVRIEDLLGRDPVVLDAAAIAGVVRGRVVLVTGAGGSIGSELCRQVCRFGPARLVLVEQAENSLFHVHGALAEQHPGVPVAPYIADICDSRRLRTVFARERPHVVFHAAAHKHVPMMEWNPGEAIKNNVFGTKKVAELADAHGVERFVMISTDKAVNPTSVMGASKRAAEIYVQALSQRSKTHFVTVRFGNVLGSEGSVIPLFKAQIARGGPVTVTHPEMRRYFMTIPEACQLVLQAGAMGAGGEIFILDMGEPVRIVDLARDLIRLSGLSPDEDIEIKFTGVRPGEKLFEELAVDDENVDKTAHPKIYVGRFRPHPWGAVVRALEALHALTDAPDADEIRAAFAALVPEYRPSTPAPRGALAAHARDEADRGGARAALEPALH